MPTYIHINDAIIFNQLNIMVPYVDIISNSTQIKNSTLFVNQKLIAVQVKAEKSHRKFLTFNILLHLETTTNLIQK